MADSALFSASYQWKSGAATSVEAVDVASPAEPGERVSASFCAADSVGTLWMYGGYSTGPSKSSSM
jgi:hypothetical protein